MSSAGVIDLCSDDEICASVVKDVRKGVDSDCRTRKLRKSTENKKVHRRCKKSFAKQNYEEKSSSNDLTTTQIDSSVLDHGYSPDDVSKPSSLSSLCTAPICRQFWKAGNYELGQSSRAPTQNGKNHLCIHPMFLHSNATSHKWAFGAIAELLDNAVDEIQNGATLVVIDKTTNPRDGRPALLIQDDGGGMDPVAIRRCMSFGFSDKKTKSAIGQYGNGFKTSSMRLGADVIVFTRHLEKRVLTQSVGLLSYTFLSQTGHDRIVVPTVDYEFDESVGKLEPLLPHGEEHFLSNLSVLLQWSPYSVKELLLKQFDDIEQHGTKIVIYNLWLNDDGDTELDFNYDPEDIRINADPKLFQTGQHPRPVSDQHIANLYRYSLRVSLKLYFLQMICLNIPHSLRGLIEVLLQAAQVYSSILYLRLPQSFRIILRGQVVEHHSIANDLKFPEFILYKPHVGLSVEAAVITTIGFLKEAPQVNIHGFNVYHRNRLILPFWRVVKNTTNSNARGVVGVLETNFVEPTHNKQDFEKTSLFQKLEARLKDMALEYWGFHCGLVGYQQLKKSPLAPKPSKKPLSFAAHSSFEQPLLLNHSSSVSDSPRTVCSVVEPFENDVVTPSNENHHIRSQQGLNMKRKEQRPTVGPEHAKRHAGSRCDATITQQNGVKQPFSVDEIQSHEVQENEKLRSLLLKLERMEEDLNLKVNQLRNELEDVQHEYTRLLAEAESMGIIKDQKKCK